MFWNQTQSHHGKSVLWWQCMRVSNSHQRLLMFSPWSNICVFMQCVCVCVFAPAFTMHTSSFQHFINSNASCCFFCVSFCLGFFSGGALGLNSSSPDFHQLQFQGLGHQESWFQSLFHLTWFQSPFPADMAGCEAGSCQPVTENKELSCNEDNEAWQWLLSHFSGLVVCSFLCYLVLFSILSFWAVVCLSLSGLRVFWHL